MNCTQVREQLPGFLYGDLASDEAAPLRAHLDVCTACRQVEQALATVRRQLDAVPPRPTSVQAEQIYRLVGNRQTAHARHWRLAAIAAASIAALLALVIGLQLQVHIEAHQVVLRWADVPPPAPPANQALAGDREPSKDLRIPAALEKVQVVSELIQGQHEEIARLQYQVGVLQRELIAQARQWQSTERDVAAFATSSQLSFQKGGSP